MTLVVAGLTVTDVKLGVSVTVSWALLDFDCIVAVMVLTPATKPVAVPFGITVAMVVLLDVQLTKLVTLFELPSE